MTKPAIVIGAGGTGQWVLTHLKRNLLEANEGVLPDTIRLFSFDTVLRDSSNTPIRILSTHGEVVLQPDEEYHFLGGDLTDFVQSIKQGEYPSLSRWFDADHYLATLPPDMFRLTIGAGRLRPLGRLALLQDLARDKESVLRITLRNALSHLYAQFNRHEPLRVFVVASLVGGTGSAMFIDLASLVRELCERSRIPNIMTGFLVLPGVFGPDMPRDSIRNCASAWRELNRFMVTYQDRPTFSTTDYFDSQLNDTYKPNRRLFDICYLVDGGPDGVSLSSEPENGVFPSIANAIDAMTNDVSGNIHREWVSMNLAPKYASHPGEPMYSAFGCHAFILPIDFSRELLSHRLASEVMDRLLMTVHGDPSDPRRITRLSPSHWSEKWRTGRDDVLSMLSSKQFFEDAEECATKLMAEIARVLAGGPRQHDALKHQVVLGSGDWRNESSILTHFIDFDDQENLSELSHEVNTVLRAYLADSIPTSKALREPTDLGYKRLIKTSAIWKQEYLGSTDADGTKSMGKIGWILDSCSRAHCDTFCRFLQLWLQSTLMEHSEPNPPQPRIGGFGYAYDLLDSLAAQLATFRRLVEKAEEERSRSGIALRIEKLVDQAESTMFHHINRKLLFWNHPRTHESQEQYLAAVQAEIDYQTKGLLLQVIQTTVKQMEEMCKAAHKELASWQKALAVDDLQSELSSVCSQIEMGRDALFPVHDTDAQIRTQTILGQAHDVVEQEDVTACLAQIRWSVAQDRGVLKLSFGLDAGTGQVMFFEKPAQFSQHDVSAIVTELLKLGRQRFYRSAQVTNALDALECWRPTPEHLVDEMRGRAEPLMERSFAGGGPIVFSALFLVWLSSEKGSESHREFIKDVRDTLRRSYGVEVSRVDYERFVDVREYGNRNRAIMIVTHELMPVNLFRAWEHAMYEYSEYVYSGGSTSLVGHVFPAETNAARYETELSRTRRVEYRLLHPMVVALLNDPSIIDWFLIAWSLDCIRLQTKKDKSKIEFVNPLHPQQISLLADDWDDAAKEPFTVINAFDRTVRRLCEIDPDLAHWLNRQKDEIPLSLLDRLQKERARATNGQSLLGWIKEYVDSSATELKARRGSHDYSHQAYHDLAQLFELRFEELLGPRVRQTALDYDTRRFFQAANWTVMERPGYMVGWSERMRTTAYDRPVCICTFSGDSVLDGQAIRQLHELALVEFERNVRDRVIVAVTDQQPSLAARSHISGYRFDEGLAIAVLPSSVIRRALVDGMAPAVLETHLRYVLGQINLYEPGMPIRDFVSFYGRTSTIEDILVVISRGEHVGVFGLRKMGKTSLLWQLKERLRKHAVASIDIQELERDTKPLYRLIIEELIQDVMMKYPGLQGINLELVRGRRPASIESKESEVPTSELLSAFERDLSSIAGAIRTYSPDNRIVIFIDEVERMLPLGDDPGLTGWDQFWGLMRGIAQRRGFLSLVVASVDARLNREDRINNLDNPAYDFFAHAIFLSPFAEQEDREMITNIGQLMGARWEESALVAVHNASGGHPCISRELCSLAFLNTRPSSVIANTHVHAAIREWLEGAGSYADQLWIGRLSDQEKQLLIYLAQEQRASGVELVKAIKSDQIDARHALASLKERHIVTFAQELNSYAITFDVFRLWIRENILGVQGDIFND